MEEIITYLESIDPVMAALYAGLFTWGLTALGASFVFFFKSLNRAALDGMLGFTGGVMVAASFWSLLAPGIEMSPGEGFVKVIPAAIGFFLGALYSDWIKCYRMFTSILKTVKARVLKRLGIAPHC